MTQILNVGVLRDEHQALEQDRLVLLDAEEDAECNGKIARARRARQAWDDEYLEHFFDLESIVIEIRWCEDSDDLLHEDYVDGAWARSEAESMMEIHDGWPFSCIDWDDAAEELLQDYTEVTYKGDSYYYRG